MTNILSSRSIYDEKWVYEILKDIIKPDYQVLIIGFSFFDFFSEAFYRSYYGQDGEYDLKMKEMFSTYGISENQVNWLYYFDDMNTNKDVLKLINEADIIYFPGGAPDLMMKRIIEKGLLKPLKDFNKIIMGSSAGAMIQLENYHISIDNEYSKYMLEKGLGYVKNLNIEVHFKRRKKQKKAMRKTFKLFKKPIITIPDDGLVVIQNDEVNIYNTAQLYYFGRGRYKK